MKTPTDLSPVNIVCGGLVNCDSGHPGKTYYNAIFNICPHNVSKDTTIGSLRFPTTVELIATP